MIGCLGKRSVRNLRCISITLKLATEFTDASNVNVELSQRIYSRRVARKASQTRKDI